MLNYVLTTKKNLNLASFEVVSSVKDIRAIDNESILVVDSYSDRDFEFAMFLVKAISTSGIKYIALVGTDTDNLVKELLVSIGAYVLQDDDVLYDLDLFSELITELKSQKNEGVSYENKERYFNTLMAFLEEQMVDQPRVVQRNLENSVQEVQSQLDELKRFKHIGLDFLKVIRDAVHLENSYLNIIQEKEKEIERGGSRVAGAMGGGVLSYPTYSYTGSVKMLVVKEYTSCQYLTSFLIALRDYIYTVYNQNTRLVVISREDFTVDVRYSQMFSVSIKNLDKVKAMAMLKTALYTVTPTKGVLDAIFEPLGTSLIIVLDRTYKKEPIITGRNLTTINAVSSLSKMRAFGLDSSKTIVNNIGEPNQLAYLQHLDNFPSGEASRIDLVQKAFREDITKICYLLGFAEAGGR